MTKESRLKTHPCWRCKFLGEKEEKKGFGKFFVPVCASKEKNPYQLDYVIAVTKCCHFMLDPAAPGVERCPHCGRLAEKMFTINIVHAGETIMSTGACLLCLERVPGWSFSNWQTGAVVR